MTAPRSSRPPNFLIIGSGESGTSWLYAALSQHPQVYLPEEMRPEPHFFFKSWEYERGFDHYVDRWFDSVPDTALAVGERSSSYIFGPQVPERISAHLPGVRMILMLREPVDRALSNWRFSVESGLEPLSFSRAVQREDRRLETLDDPKLREIQPHAYLARSRYGEQVVRFLRYFDREQLLILNSDLVKRDEKAAWNQVTAFLGIDPNAPFRSPGSFPTSTVRSRRLQIWLRRSYGREFDHAIENTRSTSRASTAGRPLRDVLLRANLTTRHPELERGLRRELTRSFASSNSQLAPHIDWDPQRWKEF